MKQIFNFWLKPTQTIDSIEQEEPDKISMRINILLFFISLYLSIQIPKASIKAISHNELILGYLVRILMVLFLFLFFKYVFAFLFWATSKLFQGESTIQQIRLVLTYSLTPFLVLLPFACIQFSLALYMPDTSMDETFSALFKFTFSVLVFSYLVTGLSKVNKFSYGYGILTILLVGTLMELISLLR